MPPSCGAETASLERLRCMSPMRCPERAARETATVMTPKPPT